MPHSVMKQVLLPSFLAKLRSDVDVSSPEILQDCFRTAGLSFHGQEALQLHFHLFSGCFAPCANHYSKTESRIAEESTRVSSRDYFLSITDTKLKWFTFYLELLPYIRIPEAVQVMSSLTDFIGSQAEKGDLSVMELCLVMSSLELFLIIFMDLMAKPDDQNECQSDTNLDENLKEVNELAYKLSKSVALFFCHIVESLKKEETVSALRKQALAFPYVLDFLSLSLILLHPLGHVRDIINFISKFKRVNTWPADFCDKSTLELEIKVGRKTSEINNGNESLKTVNTDSQSVISESEETKKVSEKKDCTVTKFPKDRIYSGNAGGNWILCEKMLMVLREEVESKSFVTIARFVVSCDKDQPDIFNDSTRNISSHKNSITIGHYVLERQIVSSHTKKRLLALKVASRSREEIKSPLSDELENALTDLTPSKTLGSVESLDYLKKALNNRESSWSELLSQGLKNTDMSSWWNAGFYDLVWENLDWLSNETNTAQVVAVLHQLSLQDSVHVDDVKRMTQLFTAMYKKLPMVLQENLVMSMFSTSESQNGKVWDALSQTNSLSEASYPTNSLPETSRDNRVVLKAKDVLEKLKSEEEVLTELTPLLNKLTINSVFEIAPDVLKLCLYHSDTVLCQMVQVAVRNKGQILPVIELLRQIPKICTCLCIGSSQSRLSHCLLYVISKTCLDEKLTENVIFIITQLTVEYIQVVDAKRNFRRHVPGVFSVHEVLQFFIFPGLDRTLNGGSDESDGALSSGASLSCLTSVVEAVKMERFDELKFLTLIKTVAEIFIQNFTISYQEEEEGGGQQALVIKQNAFLCLETLIRKACEHENYFSEVAMKCFRDLMCESGLLAVAVCYPFFHDSLSFQMLPFLRTLLEWETKQDSPMVFQMVIRLMQLGLINDLVCQDVCDIFLALRVAVSSVQLTTIIAHVLSQSLPCQMVSLHKMTLTLIECMEIKNTSTGPRGEKVPKECRPYLWYVEILTDALLLLHNRSVPDIFFRHFVSNFQASVQGLLSNVTPEDMPDLPYFLFYQCCMLMICLSGDTSQGVQVLAISMLNHWSHWLHEQKAIGKHGLPVEELGKQSIDTEWGSGDKVCPGGEGRKEPDTESRNENGQSWNLDDLQTLMDVVVCVADEDVRQQLLKQLQSVTDAF